MILPIILNVANKNMYKVAVVIPCYNEVKNISEVIRSVHRVNHSSLYQLIPIVVNDKSTDRSSDIASKENCVLLDLPVNLGIGGAVQSGFKYAVVNDFDAAIQMDGDGQHPAEEIEKILSPLMNDDADVIIGSRFITGEGFQSSFWRRLGIGFFKLLLKRITGQTITDSTSGFRAVNRKTLAIIAHQYPDDYPEPVAIVIFSKNNLKMKEVQVEMKERQGGQSTIGGVSSMYYMIKVSLSICFTYFKK